MSKVLFLDVDGVLNGWRDFKSASEINPLNPGCCNPLLEVLNTTGAQVVFTSVWRLDHSDHGWRKVVRTVPLDRNKHMHYAVMTPRLRSGIRGEEIDKILYYLGNEVEKYAIVDDDHDMLPHQKPFFVKTKTATGMTQADADKLIELLK